MEFKEYQQLTNRTNFCEYPYDNKCAIMVMGMYGEFFKIIESANKNDLVRMENVLGDILWYMSEYYTLRKYELKSAEPSYKLVGTKETRSAMDLGVILLDFNYKLSSLQNMVKRAWICEEEINKSFEIDLLNDIHSCIGAICFKYELNVRNIMKKNIKKLELHYKDFLQNEE